MSDSVWKTWSLDSLGKCCCPMKTPFPNTSAKVLKGVSNDKPHYSTFMIQYIWCTVHGDHEECIHTNCSPISERPNQLKLSSAEPRSFGHFHQSFGFGRTSTKKWVRITQKWRIFHQKFDKPNRAYICAIY